LVKNSSMRIIITLLLLIVCAGHAKSQNLNDFGRIVLNTFVQEQSSVPEEAKNLLKTKLDQIATNFGMAGSNSNPRFVLTATVNVISKDVTPGPPAMISENIEITFIIGDAISQASFANAIIPSKGVGINENKALIQAIKGINPNSTQVKSFIENGKTKIIEYYASKCDFILKEAETLANQGRHDEAIYNLSLVPDVCQDCYFKCLDKLAIIYQQKIDNDCQQKLTKANAIWAAKLSPEGADEVSEIINTIDAQANCQEEIKVLNEQIKAKLTADEKARWEFKMKQYSDRIAAEKEAVRIAEQKAIRDDEFRENQAQRDQQSQEMQASRNYELDKLRINAYKTVAAEYARNQPKTVTYNNIYWR